MSLHATQDESMSRRRPYHAERTADSHAAFLLPHLKPGMALLDLGCGPGSITVGLAAAVAPALTTGIDLSPQPVEGFEVVTGDVMSLPFADATFDAIYASALLQHMPDPLGALREARRVARPGAVIGVVDADWDGELHYPTNAMLSRSMQLARQGGNQPVRRKAVAAPTHGGGFPPRGRARAGDRLRLRRMRTGRRSIPRRATTGAGSVGAATSRIRSWRPRIRCVGRPGRPTPTPCGTGTAGLYIDGAGRNHQAAAPDGQLCSAGGTADGRYAAMDVPGNWMATPVNNNFTVRLHDQARHGADYIRVYVTRQGFNPLTQRLRWADLELVTDTGRIAPGVGTTESDPVLYGVTISIAASAPGRTGRHMVYTIWQASHSDQSYYLCADVLFPGTGGVTPTSTPAPTTPAPTTTTTTTTPPAPTTTSTSTAPVPPTSGPRTCSATYAILNQWPGGFQAEVRVTAGSAALTGCTVFWTYSNGQSVGSYWSTAITTSGSAVTARNVSYNGTVAAGTTTNFGFLGSWSGTNSVPALSCTAV